MNKTKCDCSMSHDMTFCTNQTCNSIRKCMRFGGNHVMTSDWNSFSDFGSDNKYVDECRMYIKAKRGRIK